MVEVIGVGFGRTGTLSLKVALERLGVGPCEHMHNLFRHPERFSAWHAVAADHAAGRAVDWEAVYAGYRATVDWPGAYFWRELVAAYPEAKVILTVRDPERWYASAARTIYRLRSLAYASPVVTPLLRLFAGVRPEARHALQLCATVIWDGTFGGRFEERAHAIRVFQAHNAAVRAAVPAERLLVYDVRDGWAPLCRFLGVPEPPGEPFPRLNDADAFEGRMRWSLGGAFASLAAVTGAAALLTVALAQRFGSGRRSGG